MMRVKKCVLTAAAPAQRRLPLQMLIDRDGVERSVLAILLEEAARAGMEEIAVVVCPGDADAYAAYRDDPEHRSQDDPGQDDHQLGGDVERLFRRQGRPDDGDLLELAGLLDQNLLVLAFELPVEGLLQIDLALQARKEEPFLGEVGVVAAQPLDALPQCFIKRAARALRPRAPGCRCVR